MNNENKKKYVIEKARLNSEIAAKDLEIIRLEGEVRSARDFSSAEMRACDDWSSKAINLATEVGNYFMVDVGDNINGNCPIKNASRCMSEAIGQHYLIGNLKSLKDENGDLVDFTKSQEGLIEKRLRKSVHANYALISSISFAIGVLLFKLGILSS